MKVEFPSGMNVYRKNVTNASKSVRAEESSRSKIDVMQFSHSTTAPAQGMASLKSSLLSEAGRPTSVARLEQLSQSIKNGTYSPTTDELADAILNA